MILKFKLLVLIIFYIFNNYLSQDYHQRDLITYDKSNLTFLKKNLQPVNGIVYCDHGEIGNFIQGKREGRHKEWFENGQLRGDWNFENGLAEGFIIRRYDNWQIQSELNYKKGKLNGMAKSWYRNGDLRAITNFSMGKLDGNNKFWHKNGTLMMICNYKKGKLIDDKCWDINGQEINCN